MVVVELRKAALILLLQLIQLLIQEHLKEQLQKLLRLSLLGKQMLAHHGQLTVQTLQLMVEHTIPLVTLYLLPQQDPIPMSIKTKGNGKLLVRQLVLLHMMLLTTLSTTVSSHVLTAKSSKVRQLKPIAEL
jgi:hypothetical protein